MIESATGLVLRARPLTETSLIIHWLTPNLGRVATVAKGARRPKSPFRGKLDLFYLADFSFQRSRRSDLHNLREVSLKESHPRLREDLGRIQQASYCAALLEQATEAETPLPGLFELVGTLLAHLGSHPTQPQTIFAFELKLLEHLGLQPDLEQGRLTAGAKEVARQLFARDWALASRLKLSGPQVEELRQFLHGFLVFHLGKVPAGRSAALESSA
jgi:DNA repair protein RecO (recombination protein O)